jgi:cyclopropane fatty-acyl-phospholipid synthase-like methyltransferase
LSTGTEEYYRARANEYDVVYDRPDRQADLSELRARLPELLTGRHVLEVAAGTGYWTDVYAGHAASVAATDVNVATLDVARRRRDWPDTVRFIEADAFDLRQVEGQFDAAMVGFFWSHVRLEHLGGFLADLADRLEPGAPAVFIDNCYVDASNSAITRTDEAGNTYQRRQLADGTSWEVLKNFPTTDEIRASLAPHATTVTIDEVQHYWIASCAFR